MFCSSFLFLPPLIASPLPLSTSICIPRKQSKDMKLMFHKAVKKISHVRVVTQLYMQEDDDNVMMTHHWMTCNSWLCLNWTPDSISSLRAIPVGKSSRENEYHLEPPGTWNMKLFMSSLKSDGDFPQRAVDRRRMWLVKVSFQIVFKSVCISGLSQEM